MLGPLLLLLKAAFWVGAAAVLARGMPERRQTLAHAFAGGGAAFLFALGLQLLVLPVPPAAAGPLMGALAVLLVVGPSEELFKAAATRLSASRAGWRRPRAVLSLGVAAAAGYTFIEHLGRFLDPATPPFVLISKSVLGTSLHVLLAPIWCRPLAEEQDDSGPGPGASRRKLSWASSVAVAALVHGLYDCGSFLPAWTGGPLGLALAAQVPFVAVLLALGIRELRAMPPNDAGGRPEDDLSRLEDPDRPSGDPL